AFRVLATNVDFVNLDRGARTIMVTSALRGEGKSTTVANLAVAFARSGRRVALVDLDLRRPTIATFFGLKGRPGLTQVVLGHTRLDDAIAKIAVVDERELKLGAVLPGTKVDGGYGYGGYGYGYAYSDDGFGGRARGRRETDRIS